MKTPAMHKLPRFDSFNEDKEKDETKDDKWHQHVRLPLPPSLYRQYTQASKPEFTSKSALLTAQNDNARLGNEHIYSAIADLIRALDIDAKELIDYLLDSKDLVKCQPTEEP